MNIVTSVTVPSQGLTSSLNGRLLFDQGRGKFAVTEESGQERTRFDILGLTTVRSNGQYSARYGQIASTGEDVAIIARPGQDLRPEVG